MGLQSSNEFWKIGYRLENAEIKLENQRNYHAAVRDGLRSLSLPLRGQSNDFTGRRRARHMLEELEHNINNTVEIKCEANNERLRVGSSDYRTDARDSCLIYTGSSSTTQGPDTMFEIVDLGDEAFGLRSLSNEKYVQVIPPGSGDSFDPWKLSVGGVVPGAAERFRISPDGYLYSGLVGGFFSCSPNNAVTGTSYSHMGSRFLVERVSDKAGAAARDLASLSAEIMTIQSTAIERAKVDHASSVASADGAAEDAGKNIPATKICLGVPMTSKGTAMKEISESPVWSNLFDSFMESIDWHSNELHFGFFFGFDKADEMYDTGDAWSDIREYFRERATQRLRDQLVDNSAIEKILKEQLSIKLSHFDHLEGSPTQVVSQLMLKAYAEGYDYFYQVNDDTQIISPNWATTFISILSSNPVAPNVGVTGPLDLNNDKIFTHSFVHRTHIEIFGYLFPPSFKNWWSDDWISTVYGETHTFRPADIHIQHNVGAQKLDGYTRYAVDEGAKLRLDRELMVGFVQVRNVYLVNDDINTFYQIDKWLAKHSFPRLPLPVVCGYIPLVRHLADSFATKQN